MTNQEYLYTMNITITIKGTPDKKNTVRDQIKTLLQNAKTTGNIENATWTLTGTLTPEGATI